MEVEKVKGAEIVGVPVAEEILILEPAVRVWTPVLVKVQVPEEEAMPK